ncbi:Mov34/MPN/PAD-1 family protein [uncultured Sphingomonas sp.]|uniref:Mov34/MPN/PAD-1 family protein n=1 Tax=uncultured Sphingomonas sp. TaxID=158754 RepID=UPI0035CB048B
MGDAVTFVKGIVDEITARAAASPVEICGLLLGAPHRVTAVRHCRNVAPDPAIAFEIDPGELIGAHRAARAGGPPLVGCYHSHPVGPPLPSARDADEAAANGWLWVIVGQGGVGVFRAVADLPDRARFRPVRSVSEDDWLPELDSNQRPSD